MDPVARSQHLVRMFTAAPLPTHLGMTLRYDDDLRAVVDLAPGDHLNHALGQVHGGIMATLIDTAAWFTAAVHYDTWLATVEFQTRLLEPVAGERLTAAGSLIRAGRSLAVAEACVQTEAGRSIATGSGTFAVTALPIEPRPADEEGPSPDPTGPGGHAETAESGSDHAGGRRHDG